MLFNKSLIFLSVVGMAVAIAACGSESVASEDSRAAAANPAVSIAAMASGVKSPLVLPIEQGIYADAGEGCAKSKRVFFYEGKEYGQVAQAQPEIRGYQSATPAYIEAYKIERVGPAPRDSIEYDDFRGFTRIWAAGEDVLIAGIQASANARFVLREGEYPSAGPNGGRFMGEDTSYQKCNMAQLSAQMQATIRAERPSLAGGAAAPTAAVAAPTTGKVAFPPLEKGYYAINMSCAQAIADGGDMIAYLDEKKFGAWDGFSQIQGFESLGGNRYRVTDRLQNEAGKWDSDAWVMIVRARTSFTREEDGVTHNFCPANQVPADIKANLR